MNGEIIILKRKNPLSSVELRSPETKLITFPRFASLILYELSLLIFVYNTFTKTNRTLENIFYPISQDPCLKVAERNIDPITAPPHPKALDLF